MSQPGNSGNVESYIRLRGLDGALEGRTWESKTRLRVVGPECPQTLYGETFVGEVAGLIALGGTDSKLVVLHDPSISTWHAEIFGSSD